MSKILDHISFSDSRGRETGYIWCGHARNDSAYGRIGIPVGIIKGEGPGPTFLLIAGTHGDEYVGQAALAQLFHTIDHKQVSGQIILCPALNVPAVQAGTRLSPHDGLNQNAVYPGNSRGSLTEKIAAIITEKLMPQTNFMADIHSGGRSLEYLPGAFLPLSGKADIDVASYGLATAFGAGHVFVVPQSSSLPRHATGIAHSRNIPAIALEIGGTETVTPELLKMTINGIFNMLAHVGMLARTAVSQPTQTLVIRPEHYVISPEEGLFVPQDNLGAHVKNGNSAGQIFNNLKLKDGFTDIAYPADGVLVCMRRISKSAVGDCLLHLAEPDEGMVKSLTGERKISAANMLTHQ